MTSLFTHQLIGLDAHRRRCCWWPAPNAKCKCEAPLSGEWGVVTYADEHYVDVWLFDDDGCYGYCGVPVDRFSEEWMPHNGGKGSDG